jgi:murein DD-endopeptidase MepM/ murein hydrolase activator NlpD
MPHAEYPPSEADQTSAAVQPPPVAVQPAPPADPHAPVASPTAPVSGQPLPPAVAPSSGPTAYFGPPLVYAVATAAPLQLWQAARHRHVRERERVNARGRLETTGEGQAIRVKKGDTLRSLAKRYGTTAKELLFANAIRHPTDLAVGQTLVVPGHTAPMTARERREERAESARTPKTYRAKHGDTIYSIGRQFKVSPKEIEALNGFTQKTHLLTGQAVRLPGASGEEQAGENPPRRIVSHIRMQPTTEVQQTADAGRGMGAPDHPIPYADLPGRLEGPQSPVTPPQRPIVPPVAIPQPPPGPVDAQVLVAGKGRFIWPVHGAVLTAFGPKAGGQRSDGVDISAADGTPVLAAAAGDVVYAGSLPDLGNLVLVKHMDGWITAYAHLSRTEVRIKDHVTQGQEVGQAGRSGSAVQSEVYFEVRYAPTPRDKARPVDPALLLASQ